MNELFNIPEQLSPRLKWMADIKSTHGITTWFTSGVAQKKPWTAALGTIDEMASNWTQMELQGKLTFGETEHDALVEMAVKNNWNFQL